MLIPRCWMPPSAETISTLASAVKSSTTFSANLGSTSIKMNPRWMCISTGISCSTDSAWWDAPSTPFSSSRIRRATIGDAFSAANTSHARSLGNDSREWSAPLSMCEVIWGIDHLPAMDHARRHARPAPSGEFESFLHSLKIILIHIQRQAFLRSGISCRSPEAPSKARKQPIVGRLPLVALNMII